MNDEMKVKIPIIKPKRSKNQKVEYEEKERAELISPKGVKKIEKVDKDTMMMEIVVSYPELAFLLTEVGMHCVGCPASSFETLGEGCAVHGFSEKETDALIGKLNEEIGKIRKMGDKKRE